MPIPASQTEGLNSTILSIFRGIQLLRGHRARRFLQPTIWASLVIACALSLTLRQADPQYEFDLLPQNIVLNEGTAFQAPVGGRVSWPWQHAPDTKSGLRQSRLMLFEDGRPLGPPHQLHSDIRTLGGGRYSHWNKYILFSTSDNSDPRTNNRRYHAVDHLTLSPSMGVLPWLLLFAWVVAHGRNIRAFAMRSDLVRRLVFSYGALERQLGSLGSFLILSAPIVVFANVIIIRHWPMKAIITPDTELYIGFNEIRTLGYPFFLKTVTILLGNLDLLVPIQLNLLLASILILGWAVRRVLNNLVSGLAVVLVLALDTALLGWSLYLMTEGLFVPLLIAHAGFALLLLVRPTRTAAAFAGLTLIAALLVRPAAYSLLLSLPLLILLLRSRQVAMLAWTIVPAVILYLAAAGAHRAVLGTWQSQSFGGFTLLGKVALLIDGDVPGAPPLGEEIYRRIAPQVKEADTKKFPAELWLYTSNWYDQILYREISPVLNNFVTRPGSNATYNYDYTWSQMNSTAWSLALHVIEQYPVGYLRLVAAQYYGLWAITLSDRSWPVGETYLNSLLQSAELLRQRTGLQSWAERVGLGESALIDARQAYSARLASYRQLDKFLATRIPALRPALVGIAACVVLVLCPYWLWRLVVRRPVVGAPAALLYLGMALNSYYLLVASVEFAVPRYVDAFEGITLTIDIIALSVVFAHRRKAIAVILPTLHEIFWRKRTAEITAEIVSAAKAARG